MQTEKSPGNYGLSKKNYETFCNEQKKIFEDSTSETKEKEYLSIS